MSAILPLSAPLSGCWPPPRKRGRKVGICGQAPSDYPEFAEFLVGKRHRLHFPPTPDSVIQVKRYICRPRKLYSPWVMCKPWCGWVGLRMQVPGLMAVLSIPVCIIFQTPPWRFIKMGGMLCFESMNLPKNCATKWMVNWLARPFTGSKKGGFNAHRPASSSKTTGRIAQLTGILSTKPCPGSAVELCPVGKPYRF